VRLIAYLLLLGTLTLNGCKKNSTIPDCVRSKVEEFKTHTCEHGASVKEYKFQNKSVYVFVMGNCGADLSAGVIDQNCISIGSLGGITGNTQIGGADFSTSVYVRTIWALQ
jgi:hypothetical protein